MKKVRLNMFLLSNYSLRIFDALLNVVYGFFWFFGYSNYKSVYAAIFHLPRRGVDVIIFACSKTKLLRNPEIPFFPPLVYTHITYSHT